MVVRHLAVSLFISSIMVIVIMLMRKIFKNQLSSKWKYNLWFLLLVALVLPYFPTHLLSFGSHLMWQGSSSRNQPLSGIAIENETPGVENGNWMHDFSISVDRLDFSLLNQVLTIVWIVGIVVMMAFTIHAWIKVFQLKKSASRITNNKVLSVFEQCKPRMNVTRPVVLLESKRVHSPLTFGIMKTYIILPSNAEEWLSMDEIRYICLHELHHYKYKDIVTNYLMTLFQILYWFNPLVWMAFQKMRLDREVACDSAVLNKLDQNQHAAYGHTMITCANNSYFSRGFAMVNQFAGSKQQLKERIECIAAFKFETRFVKLKGILIFILLVGFLTSQIPIVSAMSYGEEHSQMDFDNKNVVYEDLSAVFDGYEGSFVLYDLQENQYNIYNKDKSTLRVSPNSTYKIYSALFALELGVITRNDHTMKWNGTAYPYQSWNQNQNLFSAMDNSVTWYFQQLDKKMQMENIESFLQKIQYGNQDLSGGIDDYWIESSLKISPIEQLELLQDFYTNQFGFNEENVQFIKDILKLETKDNATLYGKTGTGTVNGKNVNGWFVGYVETENNTYFFVTNIENDHHASGSAAAKITKSILHDKGIY